MLLSLVPPSYIVVLMRELVNKQLSIISISSKLSNMAHLPSNADMEVKNNIRERFISSNKMTSRSISVSSAALLCAYHLRMECNNDLSVEMEVDPINSSQLSYSDDVEREGNPVSKTTNLDSTRDSQHILHVTLALNKAPKPQGKGASINNTNISPSQEDVINIQLPYDLNRLTKADLWDGNFHTISLHSLLEYLFSNIKCIVKYIDNKSIDVNKSNDTTDLKGIGDATWKFITSMYNSD